jgi:GTPase SAR1 family protein
MRHWLAELGATMPDSFICCIVANKIDQVQDRQITTEQGKQIAAEFEAQFQETSALTGHGVKGAFHKVCEKFIELDKGRVPMLIPDHHHVQIDRPVQPRSSEKSCC